MHTPHYVSHSTPIISIDSLVDLRSPPPSSSLLSPPRNLRNLDGLISGYIRCVLLLHHLRCCSKFFYSMLTKFDNTLLSTSEQREQALFDGGMSPS